MRHIPLPLLNGLMTRSGFEPKFLRVNICCKETIGSCSMRGRVGDNVLGLFKEQC